MALGPCTNNQNGCKGAVVFDTNLYGYVFNDPINLVDPSGKDVTVHLYTEGTTDGHIGVSINGTSPNGFYPKDSLFGQGQWISQAGDREAGSITFKTTPEQDRLMTIQMMKDMFNVPDYNVISNNCGHAAANILKAGGIDAGSFVSPAKMMSNLRKKIK